MLADLVLAQDNHTKPNKTLNFHQEKEIRDLMKLNLKYLEINNNKY